MKYVELPNSAGLFADWLADAPAAREFLPSRPSLAAVQERAAALGTREFPRQGIQRLLVTQARAYGAPEPALTNIDRLLQPGCNVVLACLPLAFAAGPLAVLLKCLAAAKVTAQIEQAGIPAIPVCWLNPDRGDADEPPSISMPGRSGELNKLELKAPAADGQPAADDWPVPNEVAACISFIEAAEGAQPDDPILQELKKAFAPGTPYRQACARFISALVREWGIVVFDPFAPDFRALALQVLERTNFSVDRAASLCHRQEKRLREAGYCSREKPGSELSSPSQGADDRVSPSLLVRLFLESLMPVAAHVVDPSEICSFALSVTMLKESGLEPPALWPRPSATMLDARCRKIMEKYGIGFSDLLSGRAELLRDLCSKSQAADVISRLALLEGRIKRTFDDLTAVLGPGDAAGDLTSETRARMLFQLEKLRERYERAASLRREAIERQVDRVCCSLVPGGKHQEEVIAGLYFILRNSSDFLHRLYEALNIESFTHQLIPVE